MYKRLHVSGITPAKRGVPVLLHVFAVEIISIHATVWGASIDLIGSEAWLSFQFTPPCGGGPVMYLLRYGQTIFQFTPPCGGGRANPGGRAAARPFQFTPPYGGEPGVAGYKIFGRYISIHAPCGGGR